MDQAAFDTKYLTDNKPNERFESHYINSPEPIRELIRVKVGVACFSEKVDEILLWSLYADKHKGFCLEFDTRVPFFEKRPQIEFYKVNYPRSNSYRQINILDILNKPNVLDELLTTKSYEWRYEKEWRIFCNEGGGKTYRFNPEALTAVYFGYKMPQEYKDVICSVLADVSKQTEASDIESIGKNYPNVFIRGTKIALYNMKLQSDKFKVKPEPFRHRSSGSTTKF